MYTCIQCNVTKQQEEMSKVCGKGLKFYSRCKLCSKENDKKRKSQWFQKNKDKIQLKNKENYIENKDSYVKKNKDYYEKNKKEHNIKTKRYYEQNKEKLLAKQKEYAKNKKPTKKIYDAEYNIKIYQRRKTYRELNKEKIRISLKNWRENNKDRCRLLKSLHKKKRKQHVPKWLTEDHKQQIFEFYKQARKLSEDTNIPHEVDHIIPLKGKTVSGLHVPWNLQVLTKIENANKTNKLLEEYRCLEN